jgi:hypothetical protein
LQCRAPVFANIDLATRYDRNIGYFPSFVLSEQKISSCPLCFARLLRIFKCISERELAQVLPMKRPFTERAVQVVAGTGAIGRQRTINCSAARIPSGVGGTGSPVVQAGCARGTRSRTMSAWFWAKALAKAWAMLGAVAVRRRQILRLAVKSSIGLGASAVLCAALLFSSQPALALAQFSQQGPKLVGIGAVGTALQGNSVAVSSPDYAAPVGGCGINH